METRYAKIARDPHMKSDPMKHIKRKTYEDQLYNEPFKERTERIHKKTKKNTAPVKDTIHSQKMKRLPLKTMKYLLDLYNSLGRRDYTKRIKICSNF